jgi:hypothetical protein
LLTVKQSSIQLQSQLTMIDLHYIYSFFGRIKKKSPIPRNAIKGQIIATIEDIGIDKTDAYKLRIGKE